MRWLVWPLVAVLVGGLAVQQFGDDVRGAVNDWREERRWKQDVAAGERATEAFSGFATPTGLAVVQPASTCPDVMSTWCATTTDTPAAAFAAVTPALAAVGITTVTGDGPCGLAVRGDDECRSLDLRHDDRVVGSLNATRHVEAAQAWGEPTWVQMILGYPDLPQGDAAPIPSAADDFAAVVPPSWGLRPVCTPGTPPTGHRTCETAEATGTVRGDPRGAWAAFGARTLDAGFRADVAKCADSGSACLVFAHRSSGHARMVTVTMRAEPTARGRTEVVLSVNST